MQPSGWTEGILDHPSHWTHPTVHLILVTTGYWKTEPDLVPIGERIFWIDPLTEEDLADSLMDLGVIDVFRRIE